MESETGRKLLLPVVDSKECEQCFEWVLDNLLREGDELHFVHVIPRLQLTHLYGVPPVDFMPQQDPQAYSQLIHQSEQFIISHYLSKLQGVQGKFPEPVVHIIKSEVDTQSIGHVVCKKAEELDAACVCLASHDKTRLQELFIGSVASYVIGHCSKPVLVTH